MAIYRYVKATAENKKALRGRDFSRFTPYIFVVLGLALLGSVFYPLLSFQADFKNSSKLVSPSTTDDKVLSKSTDTDLTKASNWFPGFEQRYNYPPSKPSVYRISIPKLGIKNAFVIVGSEDLSKSLIHFGGTVMPGEKGNSVVFGHSALFFNPTNYEAIFSTLYKLTEGDKVIVDYDSVTYTYVVVDRGKEVAPTDFSVLATEDDSYTMSLITCVPPGLDIRRLVVKAKILEGT